MSLNTFLQRAINTLMTPAHQTIQQPTSSPHITSLRPQQPPAQPPSSTVNTFGFPSRGMVPHVRGHGRVSGTGLCGQVAVDVAPLGDTNQMEIAWEIDPKKSWKQPSLSSQLFDVTMLDCKRGSLHMQNFRICNGLCMGKRGKEPRSRKCCGWFFAWQSVFFVLALHGSLWRSDISFADEIPPSWNSSMVNQDQSSNPMSFPLEIRSLRLKMYCLKWEKIPADKPVPRPPQGQPPAPEAQVPPSASTLEALWKIWFPHVSTLGMFKQSHITWGCWVIIPFYIGI